MVFFYMRYVIRWICMWLSSVLWAVYAFRFFGVFYIQWHCLAKGIYGINKLWLWLWLWLTDHSCCCYSLSDGPVFVPSSISLTISMLIDRVGGGVDCTNVLPLYVRMNLRSWLFSIFICRYTDRGCIHRCKLLPGNKIYHRHLNINRG
jgi:hypothetical protein